VAEYAFCGGRPANIAHAYEEDFCHNTSYSAGKPVTCPEIFFIFLKNLKKIKRKIIVLKH
jgi:hypothetical protein